MSQLSQRYCTAARDLSRKDACRPPHIDSPHDVFVFVFVQLWTRRRKKSWADRKEHLFIFTRRDTWLLTETLVISFIFLHEGACVVCWGCWWQDWCRDADGGSEGRYGSVLRRDWMRLQAHSLTLSLCHAHSAEVNTEPRTAWLFLVPSTSSFSDFVLVANWFRSGPPRPTLGAHWGILGLCTVTKGGGKKKKIIIINDTATAYYCCQDSHAPFNFLPGRLVRHFTSCNWFITFRCLIEYRLHVILWRQSWTGVCCCCCSVLLLGKMIMWVT